MVMFYRQEELPQNQIYKIDLSGLEKNIRNRECDMATIKDVAKEAGVCIATVSNYINHSRPVSRETAKIIQKAIDKLHYSPNMLARSVRNQSNKDIGVILPDLDDSYYVQVYQGIKSHFRDTDYSVNVEFSENVPEFEHRIAESFLRKKICGLILVSCRPNSWKFYYDNFTSQGIPIVLLDRNIHGLAADFISFDNYNVMKSMTERFALVPNRVVRVKKVPLYAF